jgi:LRR receptor-like serine/threonine-protein kinase FLS2
LKIVNLGGNNLNGTLPSELCHSLPQLEIFVLSANRFEGSIPLSIGNCTSLKFLDLDDNHFSGTLDFLSLYLSEKLKYSSTTILILN